MKTQISKTLYLIILLTFFTSSFSFALEVDKVKMPATRITT